MDVYNLLEISLSKPDEFTNSLEKLIDQYKSIIDDNNEQITNQNLIYPQIKDNLPKLDGDLCDYLESLVFQIINQGKILHYTTPQVEYIFKWKSNESSNSLSFESHDMEEKLG